MQGKYDILWKGMLERIFGDFLRFVFPDAEDRFDIGRGFTYLDKELDKLYPHPEETTDTRFVDKLVKVYTPAGEEKYVLFHVEVQGNYDETFTARMFGYFYRIYDRYNGRPILPVAVFTGDGGKRMGNQFHLKDGDMELIYKFKTIDINALTDESLMASDNLFAGALLIAKGLSISGKNRDERLLEQKIKLARHLCNKGFDKDKLVVLLQFAYNYALFENKEFNRTFRNEINTLIDKPNAMDFTEQIIEIRTKEARAEAIAEGKAEGKAEGIAVGKAEGKAEGIAVGKAEGRREGDENAVRVFLSNTEFSAEKIARLVGVPVSFVKGVQAKLKSKAK